MLTEWSRAWGSARIRTALGSGSRTLQTTERVPAQISSSAQHPPVQDDPAIAESGGPYFPSWFIGDFKISRQALADCANDNTTQWQAITNHAAVNKGHQIVPLALFITWKGGGQAQEANIIEKGMENRATGGADPNYSDRFGNSPLTYAMMIQPGDNERFDALEHIRADLLRAGASESGPLTAKVIAAARDADVSEIKRFLAAGHSPDTKGPFGARLLVLAAASGSIAIVEQLLAAGAKLDLQGGRGMTALMAAARGNTAFPRGGYLDIVKLLVEVAADIDAVSNPQEEGDLNALWYAKEYRNEDIVAFLRQARAKQQRVSRFASKRGIENDEISQRIVLLQSGIDAVSSELASWLGGTIVGDTLEKDVRISPVCLQVGQFRTHRWTFINPLAGGMTIPFDNIACELAKRIGCRGLFHASDEAQPRAASCSIAWSSRPSRLSPIHIHPCSPPQRMGVVESSGYPAYGLSSVSHFVGLNGYSGPWGISYGASLGRDSGWNPGGSITNYHRVKNYAFHTMYGAIGMAAAWAGLSSMFVPAGRTPVVALSAAMPGSFWPYSKWQTPGELAVRQSVGRPEGWSSNSLA